MKLAAVLFTGGKDSCLALLKAKKQYKIKYLLTILPSGYDSYMFHKPSLSLIKAQAKSLEIPLIVQKSITQKEKEVQDLEKLLKKLKQVKEKVDCIITGGVASIYQKKRIEKAAKKFKLKVINPLWEMNGEKLWKEALKNRFKVILIKICCEGLDKEILGKEIDNKMLNKLLNYSKKYGFELTAEGGDFETTVLDMPLFKKEIELVTNIKSQGPYRHFLIIKKVKLKDKNKKVKKK